jgi:hypothetical protein
MRESMRVMISTRLRWIAPALLLLPVALAGCSASDITTSPSVTTTGADGSGAGSAAPTTTSAQNPSGGCKPNSGAVPKGAAKASSPDLDLDGKRDTLWLADSGSKRKLGVRTASGATFSTTFSSAAPQAATAIGQRLGDGSEIILLNTGRSVALYSVINCEIVPTQNVQGKPYTFDLGFTGYGTGVRCVDSGRGLQVAGMLAKSKGGGKYTIYQTRIALSSGGLRAANAPRQTVSSSATSSSSVLKAARSVSCGKKNAGVDEPQN